MNRKAAQSACGADSASLIPGERWVAGCSYAEEVEIGMAMCMR